MSSIIELKEIGNTVVRDLRNKKLSDGRTFMIYSDQLPKNQSYLEYPDNSIKIVTVSNDQKSFTIVKELTNKQATGIRKKHNLV
jgi:hypothetical protein